MSTNHPRSIKGRPRAEFRGADSSRAGGEAGLSPGQRASIRAITGPQRFAPHGPVPALVARFTSSRVRAPWEIARWIVPRLILLQRQTTLYESTIS